MTDMHEGEGSALADVPERAALAFLVPVGDDCDALGHHEGSRAAVAELHRVRERRAAVEISELRAIADLCLQLELVLEDWDRYWAELFDDPRQRLVKPIGLVLAAEEVATAWGIPTDAAGEWLRQVLFLQRHLPCAWQLATTGAIRSFTVRAIADAVLRSRIGAAMIEIVDREAAGMVPGLPHTRALRVVEGLIVAADPDLAAERDANRARGLGVQLLRADAADPARRGLLAILRTPDALLLLATARRLAGQMPTRINGRDLTDDNRVALALGVLATPARALAMLQSEQSAAQPALDLSAPAVLSPASVDAPFGGEAATPVPAWCPEGDPAGSSAETGWWLVEPPDEVAACPSHDNRSPAGCAGHTCGTITVPAHTLAPKVDVVVHISAESARSGKGVARVEPLARSRSRGSRHCSTTGSWWSGPRSTSTRSPRSTATRSPT